MSHLCSGARCGLAETLSDLRNSLTAIFSQFGLLPFLLTDVSPHKSFAHLTPFQHLPPKGLIRYGIPPTGKMLSYLLKTLEVLSNHRVRIKV